MGTCNCGNLAQDITNKSKQKIHGATMQKKWGLERSTKGLYSTRKLPLDHIMSELTESGLILEDLIHLEKLSDPTISEESTLSNNEKEDRILYPETGSKILENQWLEIDETDQLLPDKKNITAKVLG